MCVCVRERACVCERECVCVCERECVCVCVHVPVAGPALLALELVDAEGGEGPLDVAQVLDPVEGGWDGLLFSVAGRGREASGSE